MLDTLDSRLHILAVSSCICDSELKIEKPLPEHHVDAIAAIAPSLAPRLGAHDISYWVLLGSMGSQMDEVERSYECFSIWPIPGDSSPRNGGWDVLYDVFDLYD